MPKTKKPKSGTKVCDLCCDQLEEGQEVLVCKGGCNSNVHRYCAGVTRDHYAKLSTGVDPFVCQFCMLKIYRAMVIQLQSEVERLKSELASTKVTLQASTAEIPAADKPVTVPLSYAVATSAGGTKSPQPSTTLTAPAQTRFVSDKKYNVVLYGVAECPSGSPRLTRLESDIASVVSVFSALDSNIQSHSIKECYRLGKFDSKLGKTKPRSLLVQFVRMADVSSVLAKRVSLKRPYFIKPDMTQEQRRLESVLLKERWNLIQSGVPVPQKKFVTQTST